jgi:hypothetical protein
VRRLVAVAAVLTACSADHTARIVENSSSVSTLQGLGANVATFLGTPSSANLAAALTDETGSGALNLGLQVKSASITLSADGTGADCAIVGTGAQSLGHADGCTVVAAVSGKIIVPLAIRVRYDFVTAAYTGGGTIAAHYKTCLIQTTLNITGANSMQAAADRDAISFQNTASGATATLDQCQNDLLEIEVSSPYTQPGTAAGTATVTVLYVLM